MFATLFFHSFQDLIILFVVVREKELSLGDFRNEFGSPISVFRILGNSSSHPGVSFCL